MPTYTVWLDERGGLVQSPLLRSMIEWSQDTHNKDVQRVFFCNYLCLVQLSAGSTDPMFTYKNDPMSMCT
jgi:hypothetical protein